MTKTTKPAGELPPQVAAAAWAVVNETGRIEVRAKRTQQFIDTIDRGTSK